MPGDPQTQSTLPKISPKFSSPKRVADSLAEDSESISRRPLTYISQKKSWLKISHSPTSSHRYESQKLKWKHSTKEVEENIQTMMNRVAYLQHEESRLVSQIESTKQKATEILRVRKKHRQHVERLVGVKLTRERRIQKNKAQAASMRENLWSNVERSKSLSATDRISLAEDTRSQMEGLYDVIFWV
jgi:DNA primase